jgi:hypothetical protein
MQRTIRTAHHWSSGKAEALNSNAALTEHVGHEVSADGPDDAPERHELPFALAMEKRDRGPFQPNLQEPPDPGAAAMSRPDPMVVVAKWARPDSPSAGVGDGFAPSPPPPLGACPVFLRIRPRPPKTAEAAASAPLGALRAGPD